MLNIEEIAKRVADHIAGHDTLTMDFIYQQHKPSGELFMRLCRRSRSMAFKHLDNHLNGMTIGGKPFLEVYPYGEEKDAFYDHILAFLCGNGMEVEWEEE